MAGSEMRRRRRRLVGDDAGAGSNGTGSCTMGSGVGQVNMSAQWIASSWQNRYTDARQVGLSGMRRYPCGFCKTSAQSHAAARDSVSSLAMAQST